MNKTLIQALLLATFAVASLSIGLRSSSQFTMMQQDEYKPYVCPYLDPALTLCAAYVVDTCVCYANGTCATIETNQCNACADQDVVLANEDKQCPSANLTGKWFRCEKVGSDEPQACLAYVTDGCTCYKNGTCLAGYVNGCSGCQNDEVALVIEDGECPANGIETAQIAIDTQPAQLETSEDDLSGALESSENTAQDGYKPYICPYNDPAITLCAAYAVDTCVCYANSTCETIETNRCNACFDEDVVSATEGEQCPAANLTGKWFRCEKAKSDEPQFCALYIAEGCICYKNGTCQAGSVNGCSDCQRDDVALVIEGSECPSNGIATATSSANAEPAQLEESEDNLAGALETTEASAGGFVPDVCPDYSLIMVNCLQYAVNSCVCYTNGTCAQVETNSCIKCQQADVISVNENEQCPEQNLNGTFTRCKAANQSEVCILPVYQGCTCYKNETCISGEVNACTGCTNEDVVLVVENGQCPENGISL